ncbi:MAG: group 1 truncated hemoglobin [Myxococcales bacterium]|nr:group 1 truncated hemoglobin [Myxococcales bacterium]
MATAEQTLYDRVGGEAGIERFVDAFYGRVLGDPELAPFFEGTSMDRLRNMQQEFFGAALDGPIRYGGRSLTEVHAGRGIEVRHFARFVEHLLETLQGEGLDEDDVYEIIARVNTYVDQITGQGSIGA